MDRFEKLAFPLIVLVAVAAVLLMSVDAGIVVVIARTLGILLVILLVVGFAARSIVKLRRGRAQIAAAQAEMAAQELESPTGADDHV